MSANERASITSMRVVGMESTHYIIYYSFVVVDKRGKLTGSPDVP